MLRTITQIASCAVLLVSIAACESSDGTVEPDIPSTPTETFASQDPIAPDFEDFSDQAQAMTEWDDPCEILDPEPVASQFAEVSTINSKSSEPTAGHNGVQAYTCSASPSAGGSRITQAPFTVIDIFDDNIQAFEEYYSSSVHYYQLFSDAEVDAEYDLDQNSSWNAAQITAQDTPTSLSAQEVVATAVLLGDFYTVEVLIRFTPEEFQIADCESESQKDCIMTAAHIAEFLATDSYLEDLYNSIESTFERTGG